MLSTLLSHQWKSFWRSRNAGKSLAIQLFIGFIILYLLGVALLVGFSLNTFLVKLAPGQHVIILFCGFVLYYFFADILMRFMMQDLPTLTIQPYLSQNISRKKLARFLNIRSLFSFFNVLPLFLFIPFSVSVIGKAYSGWATSGFMISILALCIGNHFLVLYIKRKTIIIG